MEPTRLRPLQIGEILDTAIKVYRSRFVDLVKVVLILVAPVQVLSALVQISVPANELTSTNEFGETTFDSTSLVGFIVATLGVGLLGWIASQLATGASLKIVSDSYLGESPGWRESLRFATGKLGSLVWLTFINAFLVGLGFLACIIPGVYFGVAWSVAIPALLLEDYRGTKALSRSRRLVEGFWWRALGVVLITMILGAIVGAALQGVLVAIVTVVDSTVLDALAQAIGALASSALITPFSAAVTAVLYFDLRVRKEGFDLELLARSVGVEPPTGLGPPTTWGPDEPTGPAGGGDQPPFWPPPPGWRPSGG